MLFPSEECDNKQQYLLEDGGIQTCQFRSISIVVQARQARSYAMHYTENPLVIPEEPLNKFSAERVVEKVE